MPLIIIAVDQFCNPVFFGPTCLSKDAVLTIELCLGEIYATGDIDEVIDFIKLRDEREMFYTYIISLHVKQEQLTLSYTKDWYKGEDVILSTDEMTEWLVQLKKLDLLRKS